MARWRAALGVLGPVMFTAAWAVSGPRQRDRGYRIPHEHISGLAAPDARGPHVMTAGFAGLGLGLVAFAPELRRHLAPRPGAGPTLLGLAGVAALGAGLFRRDTILLSPPGRPADHRQSWRNDVHDTAAGVGYAASILGPLALAVRFRADPRWSSLAPWCVASVATSAVLAPVFAADVNRKGNGILQRIMVSAPQAVVAAIAVRCLVRDASTP
jgi:hypothetical protein